MQPLPPPLDVDEPTLLVGVTQTYRDGMSLCAIYRAARYAWQVNEPHKYSLVLAVANSRIVGAFRVTAWLPATREHFPDEEPNPGRHGFLGHLADTEWSRYVGCRLPDSQRLYGPTRRISSAG